GGRGAPPTPPPPPRPGRGRRARAFSAWSPRVGDDVVEREPEQLLQLGAPRVRLVERARARGALRGEQRLGVEHVVAGRPAGVELLAADAEVLLRLRHPGLGRRGGGQALLGGPLSRAHRRLELVQLARDGDAVLLGGVARARRSASSAAGSEGRSRTSTTSLGASTGRPTAWFKVQRAWSIASARCRRCSSALRSATCTTRSSFSVRRPAAKRCPALASCWRSVAIVCSVTSARRS